MRHSDAAQQDPATRRLRHRELHPGLGQHSAGPARPGVVTALHEHAVGVDAVGRRPADMEAGRLRDVSDHPRRRGLAVGARHGHHRDARPDRRRTWARVDVPDLAGRCADDLVDICARQAVEYVAHGAPESLGPAAVPPGVGNHQLVPVVGGPDPDGEPVGACLRGDLADQPGQRTGREALPEATAGLTRTNAGQPDPLGQQLGHVHARLGQRRDVEGELDAGRREVEVGAFEHPELDQG